MKNVDDFVKKDWCYPETFKEQLEYYKKFCNKIEGCLSKKKDYDELMDEKNVTEDSDKLNFKEQWELYSIVNNLIKGHSENHTYLGIDLLELRQRLETVYKDVHDYVKLNNELTRANESKYKILSENITFDIFTDYYNERCVGKHFFMRLDNELKCVCCGATTKDYPLSKDELDFLTLSAEKQGILLKEVTKEDLPLLQVLMEKQDYYKSLRKLFDPFDDENEDYLTEAEEQWLSEQAEIPDLKRQIRKAHLLDSQAYNDKDITLNPKYLSDKKSNELLLEVEKELKKAQKDDSRFKDLIIEECKTARYEVLILSGAHIPTLLEQTHSENDKIALTKAYYNISNQEFRVNSEYFDSSNRNWDALAYNCITANAEINNRILQMKLRRN